MHDFLRTFFDLDEILAVLPTLLTEGLRNTLLIAGLAIALGVVAGVLLAMLLLSRRRLVRLPARLYVDVFRGLPAIVTVSLVGLGLPAAGIRPFGREPLGYAVLAIALVSAAYSAEIFRAGIQSVPRGQLHAARSLGMPYLTAMRVVVVPQGVRNVLPALAGQFIIDIKESALVYLLGLGLGQRELYFIAEERQAATYNSSALVAAGACYLLLTIPLTYAVNRLDRRMREGRRAPVSVASPAKVAA
ncbi:amino acid ABC transporter permease [Kutzneria kofuensis]|uniref:His/Glu/Gln/Arg/opine family amino acid ABC transporter permease subunit n=1 Tax=Kutzneria kofuensis TaxID=103725 RepID=A0A7W9KC98_9PSEU|nr:amino acid ABC transporter permease [Kutzneria kofuensis]MBB5889963.1 His/Glu/Gln/Arg/opine family amino acid ABC transporter permease subunit [Kutzneria kofuensis]